MPWWQSWPAISALGGLGTGLLVLILVEWSSWKVALGSAVAVFMLMILHDPKLRFRRWCQWALSTWFLSNALGFAIRAQWLSQEVQTKVNWDGSVHWSFNAAFAVVVIVLGLLAFFEWKNETKS